MDGALGEEERRPRPPGSSFPRPRGRRSTSSAGVRAPCVDARPPIRRSSARARSAPDRGTEALEYAESVFERPPRLTTSLRPPLSRAEGEQCAPTIKRDVDLRMPHKR